jgi:hypothetical protein
MILMSECDAMPNVEKTYAGNENFANWLWAMTWYCNDNNNPREWILKTYTNENVLMQPNLPDFTIATSSPVLPTFNGLDVSIYPNPFNDSVWVEINEDITSEIQVYDLQGKLLLKYSCNHKRTLLKPGFTSGTYIFKVKVNGVSIQKKVTVN